VNSLQKLMAVVVVASVVGAGVGQAQPGEPKNQDAKKADARLLGKSRTFLFTYAGAVKDLKPGQVVSIWLPVPATTLEQDIDIVAKKLPANGSFHEEKQYGNKALFFKTKADSEGTVPFEIVYRVTRKEVKTDFQANLTLEPRATDKVSRFLEPDKLVPIQGKPLQLLKDKKLPSNDQFAAAKVLYDVVDNHMKYSKEGKGWGNGDSNWACDSKFGNCSDFHSLFISMARGNKIPSKFEMGFPIPPQRGAGVIGGYHCWAWFMPQGKGWVPVDISEANRFPQMKEYYFGSLTEDRVQFTTGRDIDLEPRQQGDPLNFFIYPHVEADGQIYPQDKIARLFAFQDLK
jgi:transglutaminase-like putative cysteine protease